MKWIFKEFTDAKVPMKLSFSKPDTLFFSLMYPPLSPVSPPSHAPSGGDSALGSASNPHLSSSNNGNTFGALNPKPSTLQQLQQPHLRASVSPGIAVRKNQEERTTIKIDPSKSFERS